MTLVLFVAIAAWSWRFVALPDPFQAAARRTFWQWLITPIERNAFLRLPAVTGNFNDVIAVPGTPDVYAVGDAGLILHSPDRGETWERQTRIDWPAAGSSPSDQMQQQAIPAAKAAAQRTWSLDLIPSVVAAEPNAPRLLSPDANPLIKKVAPTESESNSIRQMEANALPPQAEVGVDLPSAIDGVDLYAIAFIDATTGITVGSFGTILRTNDGGKQWVATPAFTTAGLTAVAMSDRNRIIVAAADGTLWRSRDGGESYELASSGNGRALSSVLFVAPDLFVAAGDGGTILRSTDGGASWTESETGIDESITSIVATPTGSLLAVSNLPGRWYSTDAGANWRSNASSDEDVIRGVTFDSEGTGVALASFGGTLRSEDSGQTWGSPVELLDYFLAAIAATGPSRFVVVGLDGAVLLSRDGGRSWQSVTRGARLLPTAARFVSARRAEIELSGGPVLARGLLVSTDVGRSWDFIAGATATPPSPSASLPRIELGSAGAIRISTDDGTTWRTPTYVRYPSPMLLLVSALTLSFGLLGARHAWRRTPVEVAAPSITDLFAPDRPLRPGERDVLGLQTIAAGISRFLRNRSTEPPLTIAVTGEWGSGKSSLMGLLHHDLRERGFRPVWFNAWHHQRGENLLASLYANIRAQGIPSLATPEGLGYRWQLFQIRARRYWIRLALTVSCSALLLFYLWHHQESGAVLISLVQLNIEDALRQLGNIEAGGRALVGGGLLAALVAPAWGAFRALTSFGLDPKKLLGSLASSGDGVLAAKPGIRYQFKQEFADVTAALHPHTLTIFIDDLDRCTQEHVLEVLETINFLVSAGDCYVVLGMSRRWVETCVGLAFRELAAEAPDDRSRGDAPTPEAKPDDPRDERRRFARQYLEKLINVEVPVPVITDLAAAAMLSAPPRGPLPWRANMALRAVAIARAMWLPLLLIELLAGSWWIAQWLPGLDIAARSDVAADVSAPRAGRDPTTVADVPTRATTSVAEFRAGATDAASTERHIAAILVGGVGLLTLIVVLVVRRGQVELSDSEEFRDALNLMRPWILLANQTPRLLKRYVNHVRFVAMRQRDDVEPRSLIDRLTAKLRRWCQLDQEPQNDHAKPGSFGDPLLVALSALQQARPDWQTDPSWLHNAYESLKEGRYGEVLKDTPESNAAEVEVRLSESITAYNNRFPAYRLFADGKQDRASIQKLIELLAGVKVE